MISTAPSNILRHDLDNILSRMEGQWEAFRNESIFMTGGTGLFGRWLLESLLRANEQFELNLKITVLTRNPRAFRKEAPHLTQSPAIDFHIGDVRNFVFPARRYTYLIHGAATSAHETFQGEDPLRKFDTVVNGTRHTLDFAAQSGIKRLLFLSSGNVYGVPAAGMSTIPEDYSGAPSTTNVNSALAEAKRAAEFLTAYYAQKFGWEFVVARCFSFVGPFMPLDIHYAIGNFIRQAQYDECITVSSDGTSVRSYLYMADLVVWLLTLQLRGRNGTVYNVGSDRPVFIMDLARLVQSVVAPEKNVKVLGRTADSIGNEHRKIYVPDISKARNELQLDVWTDLNTAIRLTAASLKR
ncbi:GDP-L-fucose synthase [Sideroxyarcus emersonii]|uniref:GDP-L-fucose synthase n=1 Tax=Sideroxyarcus emersonii TaxID=2764705 RepID=A0AAN2BYH2_9PROT|nr:NAD-dependent epimerase/dehydratase family protein [Sideroxyarcus emersonii]BCK86737.1 GDP-L-fucose synthase [Sideroxyarcus emersonii]